MSQIEYKDMHISVRRALYWKCCKMLKVRRTNNWHVVKLERSRENVKFYGKSYDFQRMSNSKKVKRFIVGNSKSNRWFRIRAIILERLEQSQ